MSGFWYVCPIPSMHAVLLTKVEETGQRYILAQVSAVHSHMQWIHIYSTLFCHCVLPLCSTTVFCHCGLSLCSVTVFCHCIRPLRSVTVFHHCGLSLCSVTVFCHCIPPLCYVTVFHHCVLSLYITTVFHHCVLVLFRDHLRRRALIFGRWCGSRMLLALSCWVSSRNWWVDPLTTACMLQWPQLDTVLVYWTLCTKGHIYIHVTLFSTSTYSIW